MTVGINETGGFGNAINIMLAQARSKREQDGVMPQLVDKATLSDNTGESWREAAFDRLPDAVTVAEGEEFDNPFKITNDLIKGTPVEVGIELIFTDKMKRRLDSKALGQVGSLAGNAMQRKKAKDGLLMLDSFSTSFGGTGVTFASGYIDAAVANIIGNATERGVAPIYTVIHPFQARALRADLIGGVGTYPLPEGISARVLEGGYTGMNIAGSSVFMDAVTAPDSAGDFKGGTFAKESIVLVQGKNLYKEEERLPGRRATAVYMFDEYVYIERADSMGVEQYFDAPAPTS